MFAGIDNKARKASGAYIGVDGVARRAKKAYIGVNGKARLCWEKTEEVEPTGVLAYSYTGIKLPKPPEWDVNTYPYALLFQSTTFSYLYTLCFLSSLEYENYNGTWVIKQPDSYLRTQCYMTDNKKYWTEVESKTGLSTGFKVASIKWANVRIKNEDDSYYITNTDVFQLFSYNGVELPGLPNWDKEQYPYAVIDKSILSHIYRLMVFENLPCVELTESGTSYKYYPIDGGEIRYKGTGSYKHTGWDFNAIEDVEYITSSYIPWANCDLRYKDGSMFLKASEPQPVYL